MQNTLFACTISACLLVPATAGAALIDHGSVTQDSISGLEWLDFSQTINQSTYSLTGQFQPGGAYAGWRFAKREDVVGLFNHAGGSGPYFDDRPSDNNGPAAKLLLALMGPTLDSDPAVHRMATVHYAGDTRSPELGGFGIRSWANGTQGGLYIRDIMFATGSAENGKAHALVRNTPIPIPTPASVTLAMLGLLMLGLTRLGPRRRNGTAS